MLSARFSLLFPLLFFPIGCSSSEFEGQLAKPEVNKTAESEEPNSVDPIHPWRISPYDRIVKNYSRRYGFDWRLISAQIYAESRFRPEAISKCGAIGLMQIMPSTAKHLQVDPKTLIRPEDNIALGCFYDRWLFEKWRIPHERDRIAFTMAGYNAGRRRVLRAQSKAEPNDKWKAVEPYVPGQTRHYVRKIFTKYKDYKKSKF